MTGNDRAYTNNIPLLAIFNIVVSNIKAKKAVRIQSNTVTSMIIITLIIGYKNTFFNLFIVLIVFYG